MANNAKVLFRRNDITRFDTDISTVLCFLFNLVKIVKPLLCFNLYNLMVDESYPDINI